MVKNVLNTLRKKQKNNKGFSLVELIVVIAIMAVLVGVLAPQLIKYVEKSREATDIQNCDSIATALKTYFADQEGVGGTVTVSVKVYDKTKEQPDKTNETDMAVKSDGTNKADTTNVETALSNAGFAKNSTHLKGTKWAKNQIDIIYNVDTGKVTYKAESETYTTGETTYNPDKLPTKEAEQIKGRK